MKFGIEIEAVGATQEQIANLLNTNGIATFVGMRSTVNNTWKVCGDGSIQARNGFELVSPPLEYNAENLEVVRKVCNLLNDFGVDVNKSCGLHVHFDARSMSVKHLCNVYNRYRKFEAGIDSFMPTSRRASNNSYCKSLYADLRPMADLATTAAQVHDRYYKVNLQSFVKFGTIEFRQHSGTVNGSKVVNWVKFLKQFIDASNSVNVEETVDVQTIEQGTSVQRNEMVDWIASNGFEGVTAEQIAEHFGMTRASVQATISRLRNNGFTIFTNGPKYVVVTQRVEVRTITRTITEGLPTNDELFRGIEADLKAYYARRAETIAA